MMYPDDISGRWPIRRVCPRDSCREVAGRILAEDASGVYNRNIYPGSFGSMRYRKSMGYRKRRKK